MKQNYIGNEMGGFEGHLRSYFSSKRSQLLAEASAAGAHHSGLVGSHREALIRDYLYTVLPRRLEIGRGMVFGLGHRSREADVVLWDSDHYPSLRLADHQLFFAESTRVVLEAKSRWSTDEFADVLDKCSRVRDILPAHAPNLADDIAMLQLELSAMKEGREHDGMLISKPHIGTAAFFFLGGQSITAGSIDSQWIENADNAWPDAMILLEPGIVIGKHYVKGQSLFGGNGYLEFLNSGEDSLLIFTAALMALANERTVQIEDPTYLSLYIQGVLSGVEAETVEFPITRPISGRSPIWHRGSA